MDSSSQQSIESVDDEGSQTRASPRGQVLRNHPTIGLEGGLPHRTVPGPSHEHVGAQPTASGAVSAREPRRSDSLAAPGHPQQPTTTAHAPTRPSSGSVVHPGATTSSPTRRMQLPPSLDDSVSDPSTLRLDTSGVSASHLAPGGTLPRGAPPSGRPAPPRGTRVRRNSGSRHRHHNHGAPEGKPVSHSPTGHFIPPSMHQNPSYLSAASQGPGPAGASFDHQPGQLPHGHQQGPSSTSRGGMHRFHAGPPPRGIGPSGSSGPFGQDGFGQPWGYAPRGYAPRGYAPRGYAPSPVPPGYVGYYQTPYGPAPTPAMPFKQPWVHAAGLGSPGTRAGKHSSPGAAAFQMAAALHDRDKRRQRRAKKGPSRAARELSALSAIASAANSSAGAAGSSPGEARRTSAPDASSLHHLRVQNSGASMMSGFIAGTPGLGENLSLTTSPTGTMRGHRGGQGDGFDSVEASDDAVGEGHDVQGTPGVISGAAAAGGGGGGGEYNLGAGGVFAAAHYAHHLMQQGGMSVEERLLAGAVSSEQHHAPGAQVEQLNEEDEDPAAAKARQRKALATLRFFMRRFVRFHQSRIHSEVKAVQTRFFEIIVYLLFCLFVILSSVTSRQDQDFFWAAHSMQAQIVSQEFPKQYTDWIKTFQDAETLEDIYTWMTGPLHATLYAKDTTWWGEFEPNGAANSSADREGLFFGTNRLIGGVRVSQLRSRERADECVSLAVQLPSSTIRCFAHDTEVFTVDDETNDPAGFPVPVYPFLGSNTSLMQTTVTAERARIGLATFRADSGRAYPVPGYHVILPHSGAERAAAAIEGLWRHGYVDQQTRLLAVSFVVYSPNIDVYVMFDAVVEFTKVGALTVSMETTTARIGTIWESREQFTLVMEVLVMVFYVWYTLQELRRTMQVGFRRLLKFTTLAHDLNIFTYLTFWAFKIAAFYSAPTGVVTDSDVYYDYRTAIRLREIARLAMSGTVFIVLFKLLAYTAIIPSFGLLTRTIGNAAGPTISFLLISALLLYGFSAAYMIALGPRAFGFRNLATSATSLLRALLGDFDYEQIRRAHFLIGPVLFILFVFLGVVVLLNVIIAIISAAWDSASSDVDAADDARIARLFAQHAWAVVSGLPIIGRPLRACQRCRVDRRKKWVRSVARDITSMPVSLMLKEQPWERIRRKKDKSAASMVPDAFTSALTAFDFRTGEAVAVKPAGGRSGRSGSKTEPTAADEAEAEARFLGEAGVSPAAPDSDDLADLDDEEGKHSSTSPPPPDKRSSSPAASGDGAGSAVDVTALPKTGIKTALVAHPPNSGSRYRGSSEQGVLAGGRTVEGDASAGPGHDSKEVNTAANSTSARVGAHAPILEAGGSIVDKIPAAKSSNTGDLDAIETGPSVIVQGASPAGGTPLNSAPRHLASESGSAGCLPAWVHLMCACACLGPPPGMSRAAVRFPVLYRRAAAAVMDRGIDQIKRGDETDPTRASGPYATPLAREMNTRIALKRKILGESEYRELVRRRVQESVEALVRQHWSEVAAGVDKLKQKQVRRRRRHKERREADLGEAERPNKRASGIFGGAFTAFDSGNTGGMADGAGWRGAAGYEDGGRGTVEHGTEANTMDEHGSERSDTDSDTDSDDTDRTAASGLRERHTAPAAAQRREQDYEFE